jgi:hypothetical protein
MVQGSTIPFSKVGAMHLVLIGRAGFTVREKEQFLEGSDASAVKVSVFAASVTNETKVNMKLRNIYG